MVPSGSFSAYRKLAVGVFALAVVVVAFLLLTPAGELPATDLWDKLEHAGAFAGLAFLGFLAFPERTSAWRLAIGLIGFGSVCEFLQLFVPGRESSVEDAIANAIGVLLVSGLWRLRHLAGGLTFRRPQQSTKR
jgi:VanZ family protein